MFEPLLTRLHHFFISKYDECWIPDFESKEVNLAGDLSHSTSLPVNTKYTGTLSRFNFNSNRKYEYDIAAIISGAEPQRAIFENEVTKSFNSVSLKTIIIRGKPSENSMVIIDKITPHLDSKKMEEVLLSSNLVVCRSGYSTVMDLIRLKKNAVLIPTPGQTEQEYLAYELMKKGIFFSMKQSEFNLAKAIEESKKFSVNSFKGQENGALLTQAVAMLMDYQSEIQV